MTEVVSAVIVRRHRILLTQRRENKDFPFTWECPGGKVDGNESHHQAICRELNEELGIIPTIEPGVRSIYTREFHNDVSRVERRHITLLMYPVQLGIVEPRPVEGQGIGWFTIEEMTLLKLTPGNEAALETIVRHMLGNA